MIRKKRELGQGSFGKVYEAEAEDPELLGPKRVKVAIKVNFKFVYKIFLVFERNKRRKTH